MSDAPPPAPSRRRRPLLYGAIGFAATLTGLTLLVLGPAGPLLVAGLADGRAVWRLGELELQGVSGVRLGDLTVDRLRIVDEDGVWLEAQNVSIGWKPLRLLALDVAVESASAETIQIYRRPKLTPPRPPGGSIDIDLSALRVGRLVVAEPVVGEAAVFSVDGALEARDGALQAAKLDVIRLDAAADRLRLAFDRDDETLLTARLEGEDDGFIAAALDVAAPVLVVAEARGGDVEGAATLQANIGETRLARGALSWTQARWRADAALDLTAAPAFARLAEIAGSRLGLAASGARPDEDASPFEATFSSDNIDLRAQGRLGDDWRPVGDVAVRLDVERLAPLADTLRGGSASFEGALRFVQNVAVAEGRLAARDAVAAGVTASFAGPLRVRITNEEIEIDAQAQLARGLAPETVGGLLGGGEASVEAAYDRTRGRIELSRLVIDSPSARVEGQGRIGGDVATSLRGRWRVKRLAALDERVSGAAAGSWTATRALGADSARIVAQGRAETFGSTIPGLADLAGRAPVATATLRTRAGGVDVERLIAEGAQLRLGARGPIIDGRLDLAFEASARGPVSVGAARIEGVADATGRLYGRPEALGVTAVAQMSTIDIAGLVIEQPELAFSLDPTGAGARQGRLTVTGQAAGAHAFAEARLAADADAFAFEDLTVRAAGLTAVGRAAFTDAGPSADLQVSGELGALLPAVGGRIVSHVSLAPVGDDTRLSATASVADGRLGDLAVDALDIAASGPLDAIDVRAQLRGAGAGLAVAFDAAGAVVIDDGVLAQVTGQGRINGSQIATTEPIMVRIGDAVAANGVLAIEQGEARFAFERNGALSVSAALRNVPLRPLFALAGERAAGTATGEIAFAGAGAGARGEANLVLDDALLPARMREPLDLTLAADLSGGALRARAAATSASGLDALVEGQAPVAVNADPLRIALDGQGRATWRASGPAGALWGLVGTLDQRVTGQIDGAGVLRFAVGELSGEGGFTLANGAFSDRLSGVTLRDIDARVSFAGGGATLERFNARGPGGGTLTGSGRATAPRQGRLELRAENLRFLDRQDASAVASGPLAFAWSPDGAELSGDLRIQRAEIEVPNIGNEDIPQLDVVEINVPPALAARRANAAPADRQAPAYPVSLNVSLDAPGQIFLRGRGLDSEWSVDLRATGTAADPRLVGEARLIRGDFDLANRRFAIERGLVRFGGAPLDAQLDLVAERETPDLTARIALSGPVSDPEIALSSTPALPEDEVLPQVLFGRSIEDLSALEAAQLAAGLAELAGRSSLDIVGAARGLIGLDRFDVRETDQGLRVAGGKYLTRDVYLEVARTGLGGAETAIEWRVRPRFYIISAFAPEGDRRLSVRWRREY